MSAHNPYSPPGVPVAGARRASCPPPPQALERAVRLLWVYLGIGGLVAAYDIIRSALQITSAPMDVPMLLGVAESWVIFGGLGLAIQHGCGWARVGLVLASASSS